MSIITTRHIIADALEALEWDFQQRQMTSEQNALDTVETAIGESIDRQMIYTADILDTWGHYGHPEPEDMGMSDFESLTDAISWAVYESLRDDVDVYDVLDRWIDSHSSLFEGTDVDPEDREAAIEFLAEYADANLSN